MSRVIRIKKKGLGLIALGLLIMIASVLIGYGDYYWWDLPVWLMGWVLLTAGLVRNDCA